MHQVCSCKAQALQKLRVKTPRWCILWGVDCQQWGKYKNSRQIHKLGSWLSTVGTFTNFPVAYTGDDPAIHTLGTPQWCIHWELRILGDAYREWTVNSGESIKTLPWPIHRVVAKPRLCINWESNLHGDAYTGELTVNSGRCFTFLGFFKLLAFATCLKRDNHQ